MRPLVRLHGTLNARSGLHSSVMLEKDAALEEKDAALAVAEATNAKLAAELQRVRSQTPAWIPTGWLCLSACLTTSVPGSDDGGAQRSVDRAAGSVGGGEGPPLGACRPAHRGTFQRTAARTLRCASFEAEDG